MKDLIIPIRSRLVLRRSSAGRISVPRTMIGGVVLDDLCSDGHERIVDCLLQVHVIDSFKVVDPKIVAGWTLNSLVTDLLGEDYPNKNWPKEK